MIWENDIRIIEKIYMFFVELLFKIIRKDLTDKTRQTFKEFLQFGLVGVSNTVVSYLLYVVTLVLVSKSGVTFDYIIANVVSGCLVFSGHFIGITSLCLRKKKANIEIYGQHYLKHMYHMDLQD